VPVNAELPMHGVADALALEQGRVYYVQLCIHCHGARGDGRGAWAYRVTPRPSNLTTARTQARSDAELFRIISEPRPGTPMLGWSQQLSESQRHQLVAYLRQLGGKS
jgi:mono/diheme cytochrome c family protein